MVQASVSSRSWIEEPRARWGAPLSLALVGSLLLHGGVVVVATWIHFPRSSEKPLAAIEVTLAPDPLSLDQPPLQSVEPPKTPSKPLVKPPQVKAPAAPLPPKPVSASPPPKEGPVNAQSASPPISRPAAPEPVPQSVVKDAPQSEGNSLMAKLDSPVEVPPPAPVSLPARTVKRPLQLPEVPPVSPMSEPSPSVVSGPSHPSLVEESRKELERELKNLRNVELPALSSFEPSLRASPQLEAKATSATTVGTALKIAGQSQGSNTYLSRIRQRISSVWVAPPIDMTGRMYVVVVRFRLHRDGSVTDVEIERSSGNKFYDLAAQRAVVAARRFPPFPEEVADSFYDVYFTFVVGESRGEG